jgi:hypothetical protein
MTTELTKEEIMRQSLTLDQTVQGELERLRTEGELGDGTKTEPRCYVCCETESKALVNKLIAAGLTNREITQSCSNINIRRRDVGDKRLIDARNIWWHRREHFNVEEPAMAAYRTIVERYAEQMGIDHINGVGTAVTPLAVLHTVMLKGFFGVATGELPVTVKEMIDAAGKLQAHDDKANSGRQMADMVSMMDRIIEAAQTFVPPEEHGNFLAMVEGRSPMAVLAEKAHEVAEKAAGRSFTPNMSVDEGDAI